jgi:hypothetical protein
LSTQRPEQIRIDVVVALAQHIIIVAQGYVTGKIDLALQRKELEDGLEEVNSIIVGGGRLVLNKSGK